MRPIAISCVASIVLSLPGCSIFHSAKLPPNLAGLADQTERIDFDYGPPPVGVPLFTSRRSGQAHIQQFDIRSDFRFDRYEFAIPSISIREGSKSLTQLQCLLQAGCLMSMGGKCFERCFCEDKARLWKIDVDVTDGLSLRVYKGNQIILRTELFPPPRVFAPDGSAVTTLYRTESDIDPRENMARLGAPVAAASTKGRDVSLFIPRQGELRAPAVIALLLALVVKPPYVQSWAYGEVRQLNRAR